LNAKFTKLKLDHVIPEYAEILEVVTCVYCVYHIIMLDISIRVQHKLCRISIYRKNSPTYQGATN
jgi:hypothetical protein